MGAQGCLHLFVDGRWIGAFAIAGAGDFTGREALSDQAAERRRRKHRAVEYGAAAIESCEGWGLGASMPSGAPHYASDIGRSRRSVGHDCLGADLSESDNGP